MPKRKKEQEAQDAPDSIPRKSRRIAQHDSPSVSAATTPSYRKSILKGTPSKVNGIADAEPTPKSLRKVLFSTPAERKDGVAESQDEETPAAARNDRSARRKSARTLQQQPEDEDSDNDGETELAKQILDAEDEVVSDEEDVYTVPEEQPPPNETPSKRSRGRPKGRPKRERTPSPPPDLPPHELYFFQNRTGANKTSSNTLPAGALLNHEDYYNHIRACKDPHEKDIQRLQDLHTPAFDQWTFELSQGFNLCLYGYGSKRNLVMELADRIYHSAPKPPKIVVVNGYTPGLTIRDLLTTLATATIAKTEKLPAQPAALLDFTLAHLTSFPPLHPLTLIIHSFDHSNLRKHQPLLAQLAAHPSINLVATMDTPHFGLLWDTTLLRQFNWLFHDTTTFQPFTAELDVVENVNALLGRSGRRLGGKDGVVFVLRSLPENARALFSILVAELLAGMDEGTVRTTARAAADVDDEEEDELLGMEDEDAAAEAQDTPSRRGRGRPQKKRATPKKRAVPVQAMAAEGVEYRTLYHKAVEEFVCSSEINFRTLLKEFHDHHMLESRKDAVGTERLIVPMGREELESLLEELV